MRVDKWYGDKICDFCGQECGEDLYDGLTNLCSWAVMCNKCFENHGTKLGLGYGQHYRKNEDGEYIKIEGD